MTTLLILHALNTITHLPVTISIIDNLMDMLRSQTGGDITRVTGYVVAAQTLDDDGALRTHIITPHDQDEVLTTNIRATCQQLLTAVD